MDSGFARETVIGERNNRKIIYFYMWWWCQVSQFISIDLKIDEQPSPCCCCLFFPFALWAECGYESWEATNNFSGRTAQIVTNAHRMCERARPRNRGWVRCDLYIITIWSLCTVRQRRLSERYQFNHVVSYNQRIYRFFNLHLCPSALLRHWFQSRNGCHR